MGPAPRRMTGPTQKERKGPGEIGKGEKWAEANPAVPKGDGQIKKNLIVTATGTPENLLTEVSTLVKLIETREPVWSRWLVWNVLNMTQMELWCWTGQWCHSLPTTAKIREGMGVGNGHSSSNNHWNQLSEANSFWDNVFDKKCSGTHPPGLFTPTGTTGTSKVNSRTFRPCCNHWTPGPWSRLVCLQGWVWLSPGNVMTFTYERFQWASNRIVPALTMSGERRWSRRLKMTWANNYVLCILAYLMMKWWLQGRNWKNGSLKPQLTK